MPNKWSFLLCSLTYSQDAQHLYASAADGSVVIWEGGGGTGSKGMSKTPKFLNLTSLWGMSRWLKGRIDVGDVCIVDPEIWRNICYMSWIWYNNFEYSWCLLCSHVITCHKFYQNQHMLETVRLNLLKCCCRFSCHRDSDFQRFFWAMNLVLWGLKVWADVQGFRILIFSAFMSATFLYVI